MCIRVGVSEYVLYTFVYMYILMEGERRLQL